MAVVLFNMIINWTIAVFEGGEHPCIEYVHYDPGRGVCFQLWLSVSSDVSLILCESGSIKH